MDHLNKKKNRNLFRLCGLAAAAVLFFVCGTLHVRAEAGNLTGNLLTLNTAARAYERPETDAPVVAEFAAGSPVLILREENGWYTTFYQGRLAYIPAEGTAEAAGNGAGGENGAGTASGETAGSAGAGADGEGGNGEIASGETEENAGGGNAGTGEVSGAEDEHGGTAEEAGQETEDSSAAGETSPETDSAEGLFSAEKPVDEEALNREMKQVHAENAALFELTEEEEKGLSGSDLWWIAAAALVLALFAVGIASTVMQNRKQGKGRRKKENRRRKNK